MNKNEVILTQFYRTELAKRIWQIICSRGVLVEIPHCNEEITICFYGVSHSDHPIEAWVKDSKYQMFTVNSWLNLYLMDLDLTKVVLKFD